MDDSSGGSSFVGLLNLNHGVSIKRPCLGMTRMAAILASHMYKRFFYSFLDEITSLKTHKLRVATVSSELFLILASWSDLNRDVA